ncbi:MAG: PDZ domain-containing protein [Fimbriimonas sp.]
MIAALFAACLLAPQSAIVEVPFRIGEDAIVVDATVNGKKVSLMFDTGFSGAVVLNNTINLGPATGKMTLRDFVGEFEAPTVKIKSLMLGAKKIDPTDMEAVMSPAQDYSQTYNTHVDGIMGLSVIKHAITEINFAQKKFIFYPDSLDVTKRTPNNQTTFLAKLLPSGHSSLEMEVFSPSQKRLRLALDTGNSFYATTHKDVLERVGLWEEGRKADFIKLSGVASGTVESWDVRLPDMKVFGVPVKTSVWSIIDLPSSSSDSDGTIGYGFLKNFNILIDYDRRRVWLEKHSPTVENDAPGDVGISAAYSDRVKRVVVFRVAPSSPAEKAGLKAGDQILSLDGKELLTPTFRQMEKLLQGEKGTKVKLAVSRQGALSRYELERTFLVNDVKTP